MPLYRLTVKTTFPGGTLGGTNTWHIRTTTAAVPPAPSATTTIKNFYTGIASLFGLPYKWSWDGVLSEVANENPGLAPVMTPWTVQGSSGGGTDSGPAGVGLVVTWRSGTATKSGRGRTFIAPLPAGTFQSDGTILDSALNTVRVAATALVNTSLADGNGAVSVYSPLQKIGRDVQGSMVNDRVAYLSSRRR